MCNFVMDGLLYGQMEKRRNLSSMMWSMRVKLGQVVWMVWVRFVGPGCWTRENEMNEVTEKWTNEQPTLLYTRGAFVCERYKHLFKRLTLKKKVENKKEKIEKKKSREKKVEKKKSTEKKKEKSPMRLMDEKEKREMKKKKEKEKVRWDWLLKKKKKIF